MSNPAPEGSCRVSYQVPSTWPGGFLAEVTITNPGTQPIQGWRLVWTFPDGQQVIDVWGAVTTAAGSTVTAIDAGWNATIPAGGSTSFGFIGVRSDLDRAPTAFSLNGAACAMP